MTNRLDGFSARLVAWQAEHGRHGLPWQHTRDPYRVWLSEIMLQQTQVTTVLEYYPRFLARFPCVASLAAADLDEVLGLWSGLGYYSRARHLHRCAQTVVASHGGQFPRTADLLQTLPGIGRSTAAAVASFCFDERVSILDGNVKRVMSRLLAFGQDLAVAANERRLWALADTALPPPTQAHTMPRYTQGLMDLGATVCTARRPACDRCPMVPLCGAHAEGRPEAYPVKTRKLKRSSITHWVLWCQRSDGAVWLVQRPAKGIWSGLFCLPLFDDLTHLQAAVPGVDGASLQVGEPFKHVLTHRDMHLHPVRCELGSGEAPHTPGEWVPQAMWPNLGLPAPVRTLLTARR